MAGDWIKMRVGLHTHPKVVRMASALKADRLRVVGALHAAWCLFDAHSVDGVLEGYTAETMDDLIGFPGFSSAMIGVGWLEEDELSLCMPRFSEHNGRSAKRRAQDADRKKGSRVSGNMSASKADTVSASGADKKRTREEKRREDLKTIEREDRATESPPVSPGDFPAAPAAPPEEPFGKFPITEAWVPGPDFVRQAALWGINLGDEPGYTAEELHQFRDYWICEGKVKHQTQWEQTFAQSLRTSRSAARARKPGGSGGHGVSVPDTSIPNGFS